MIKTSSGSIERLRQVKLWLGFALLLVTGLLSYYSFLGYKYWVASHQVDTLLDRSWQLSQSIREEPPQIVALESALKARESRLEELKAIFDQPKTGEMLALLSSVAAESSVELRSASLGEVQPNTAGSIAYRTQPITLGLRGSVTDMTRFLTQLQRQMPGSFTSSFSIANLDGQPSAQIQLLVYRSPEPLPEKKKPVEAANVPPRQ